MKGLYKYNRCRPPKQIRVMNYPRSHFRLRKVESKIRSLIIYFYQFTLRVKSPLERKTTLQGLKQHSNTVI
jgi:hypothetical protein